MSRHLLAKIGLAALGIATAVIFALWWQWPDQNAHVVFCDVGQGDGILIWQGFQQLVVDGGRDDQILSCLSKYLPWWDRRLEVVVATHADADHIGGLDEILSNFDVQHVLMTDQAKNSSDFADFATALQESARKGTQVALATGGQQLDLGTFVQCEVVWPLRSPEKEKKASYALTETQLWAILRDYPANEIDWNEGSINLLCQIGSMKVLLTGDGEESIESALIRYGLTDKIEILKVGHHGSKNGTTTDFLKAIQPEIGVVSNGKNNSYGHPSDEVLQRLMERGVTILRTDQVGDIEVISDLKRFWLKSQE